MNNSFKEFTPIPFGAMRWKTIDNFELNTPLGIDDCIVEIADIPNYVVLKPGEEDRIRKAQVALFCKWIVENREEILANQLKYLLEIFKIKQSVLAKSLALTDGAISQFVKGISAISCSVSRQIALSFFEEIKSPGFIENLSCNELPVELDKKKSFINNLINKEKNIFTGFQNFSESRFKCLVSLLSEVKDGVWKTSLNKLLWISDFVHFQKYGIGITGLAYIKFPYGPVPEKYDILYSFLLEENEFNKTIIEYPNGTCGERIFPILKQDNSVLNKEELETVLKVKEKYSSLSASQISDLSHKEKAWVDTIERTKISYKHSDDFKYISI
jgi:hypothetical protein